MDDLHRQLEDSRRQLIEEALHHEEHMRALQKQLDLETTSHQRSRKRLSAEISSHWLSQEILSAERASHDELHALHRSLRGMRSTFSSLALKRSIPRKVSVTPARSSVTSKVAVRNQLGDRSRGMSHVVPSGTAQKQCPVQSASSATVQALQSVPLAPSPAAPALNIDDCSLVDDFQKRCAATVLGPIQTSVCGRGNVKSFGAPRRAVQEPRPSPSDSPSTRRTIPKEIVTQRPTTVVSHSKRSATQSHLCQPIAPATSTRSHHLKSNFLQKGRSGPKPTQLTIQNASPVRIGKLPVFCGFQHTSVKDTVVPLTSANHRTPPAIRSVVAPLSSNHDAFGPTSDENAFILHTYFTLVPAVAACGADFPSDFC